MPKWKAAPAVYTGSRVHNRTLLTALVSRRPHLCAQHRLYQPGFDLDSGLVNNISAHSPIPSTYGFADQFVARLRGLLLDERQQSEHMSSVLHGVNSVPVLGTPRRMVSQPSPRRAPDYVSFTPNMEPREGDRRGQPRPPESGQIGLPPSSNLVHSGGPQGSHPVTGQTSIPPISSTLHSRPSQMTQPSSYRPTTWTSTVRHTSYFTWEDWMTKTKDNPLWNEPISVYNNNDFRSLWNSISGHNRDWFRRVFHGDPNGPAGYVSRPHGILQACHVRSLRMSQFF